MQTIEELIKELKCEKISCKKLDEICLIETGKQLNKTLMSKDYKLPDYIYPVYNGGIGPSGYWKKFNVDKDTIIIAQGGSAGYVNWINENFWASAHCFYLKNPNINYRYLYFYLKNNQEKIYALKTSSTIPGISKEKLSNLDIYFPSPIYQQQIVEILDQFTELEAELEARKKQYEYWLNFLYNPEDNTIIKNYSTIKLESICIFERGKSINKKLLEEGLIPIVSSGVEPIGFTSQVNRNGEWISVATSGCGAGKNIYYWNVPFYASDCLTIKSNDEHKLLTKYLYYFLLTKRGTLISNVSDGAIPHIYARNFYNLLINLPPIGYQQKIISILDQFNNLTTNLQDGIPAEINLRKEQYQHYLHQLLNFNKL